MTDAAASALTPSSSLTLQAPEPVAEVAARKACGMVPIPTAALPSLDEKVAEYVDNIITLDVHSPAFTKGADDIRAMGNDEIRASSEVSNKLLQSPVRAMQKGSETGKVASTLLDLRRTIEDLDPRQATGLKKLLGMIPFGDKLRDYFHKYEDAEFHLDAILRALLDGQDELRKDNVALEQEKVHLWETMQRLAQYSYVVRKNNLELIKGVDRATTTTIAALRTAVIVAQALAGEKLVLTQISALTTTTSNLIASTSQLLATQGAAIQRQAADASVSVESLQRAFDNVYQSMDAIDTFKVAALDSMQKTIVSLQTEITKSQAYLSQVRGPDAGTQDKPGALTLDPGPPA
jgi:uncharacterized protein YaaN involved in tellurite resistance